MLIRFANNPGTTLSEQIYLRSLPDSGFCGADQR